MSIGGAVVVFAKCPIVGASKTRLAPLLGDEGAASLAHAMLSDILIALSDCVSRPVIFLLMVLMMFTLSTNPILTKLMYQICTCGVARTQKHIEGTYVRTRNR